MALGERDETWEIIEAGGGFDGLSDVINPTGNNTPANVKSFISLYDLRLVATEAYGVYFIYKKQSEDSFYEEPQ